ncbi:MAG: hypothetical protein ACFFDI_23660, partial [Promethearchaeota archaeon]
LLDIPARSIRFRLVKLREKGILHRRIAVTHERKLGLGEMVIYVEENPEKRKEFYKILNEQSVFSWHVPTTGRFNGYCLHTLYSLDSPDLPFIYLKLLKEKSIIKDYFSFITVDYQSPGWNFDFFNTEGEWTWDWRMWEEQIKKGVSPREQKKIVFDEKSERIDFDYMDIQILRALYAPELNTLKKMEKKLQLSESQIGRRIKSMEEKGIIRGYRTGFTPFKDLVTLSCFIKLKKNMEQVMYHLTQIPYPKSLAIESRDKVALGIPLPSKEVVGFLNGLYTLKPIIDSYFCQIWHTNPIFNFQDAYGVYDKETNSWVKLTKKFENSIEKIKKISE